MCTHYLHTIRIRTCNVHCMHNPPEFKEPHHRGQLYTVYMHVNIYLFTNEDSIRAPDTTLVPSPFSDRSSSISGGFVGVNVAKITLCVCSMQYAYVFRILWSEQRLGPGVLRVTSEVMQVRSAYQQSPQSSAISELQLMRGYA